MGQIVCLLGTVELPPHCFRTVELSHCLEVPWIICMGFAMNLAGRLACFLRLSESCSAQRRLVKCCL